MHRKLALYIEGLEKVAEYLRENWAERFDGSEELSAEMGAEIDEIFNEYLHEMESDTDAS